MLIVGNMKQTIPMLAESTDLDYKTVQSAVEVLLKAGLMKKARKIGNAQAYAFDMVRLGPLAEWATREGQM